MPAAELILLPDGGELKPEKIDPVLRAFARVRRLERKTEHHRERMADRRSTAVSRAHRGKIERLQEAIRETVRELPIRPSVVDDVVTELRRLDQQFEEVGRIAPGPERTGKDRGDLFRIVGAQMARRAASSRAASMACVRRFQWEPFQ